MLRRAAKPSSAAKGPIPYRPEGWLCRTSPARMKLARYLWARLVDRPVAVARSVSLLGPSRWASSRSSAAPISIDWTPAISFFRLLLRGIGDPGVDRVGDRCFLFRNIFPIGKHMQ